MMKGGLAVKVTVRKNNRETQYNVANIAYGQGYDKIDDRRYTYVKLIKNTDNSYLTVELDDNTEVVIRK